MKELNYERDMHIDETALDWEWLEQPKLMMRYSERLADAALEVSRAKEALDVEAAQLDKLIRNNPDEFGIDKITETVIRNTIIQQESYTAATSTYNEAVYDEMMLKSAVRAIDYRRSALENLVRLHGQQYFAGPSVPRDLGAEVIKKREQQSANSKVKITRSRKNH